MAQQTYDTSALPRIDGAKTAIVLSKWYREYSSAMAHRCIETLVAAGAAHPEVHILPGCIELPLAALRIARRDPMIEAIIAFGIIVKGDTYHFDLVKDSSLRGLERVMFECDVPVINEILPVVRIEDAAARCGNNDNNKGLEAAIAAIEVVDWRRRHPLP